MTTSGVLSAETRNALADSAHWRMLSLLFERPKTGWLEEALSLLGEREDAHLADLEAKLGDANEGHYQSLFGPGGPVSPREVTYRPMADPGRVFAQLQEYYEAFAFSPRVEEPLDHIANETGFVAYLKMKLAYALARGDREAADVTHRATERFVKEHLTGFAQPFAERLSAFDGGYLSEAAGLLRSSVP